MIYEAIGIGEADFARLQAFEVIRSDSGEGLDYDWELDVAENRSALTRIESWARDSR